MRYSDILIAPQENVRASRPNVTHKEYVNWTYGQEGNDHGISFMERTDLFILEAAQAISKLMRDWYKEERSVEIDPDDPKDVTELLEALDAGQGVLALLRYLPNGLSSRET